MRGRDVPQDKAELHRLMRARLSNWFHFNFCRVCHLIPYSDKWFSNLNETEMNIFASAKRRGMQSSWEPFYIGTNDEPLWDERLGWEGKSNKMQQPYAMCLLDYDFNIVSNAFLCHKPGNKSRSWNKENVDGKHLKKTQRLLQIEIRPELKLLYGPRKGCEILNTGQYKNAPLIPGRFPLNSNSKTLST